MGDVASAGGLGEAPPMQARLNSVNEPSAEFRNRRSLLRHGGQMKRLALLFAAAVAVPQLAHAAPCSTMGLTNPVVLQVGDTQTNLMHALGRKLRDNTDPGGNPNPITLLFITSGSCTNIAAIYTPV